MLRYPIDTRTRSLLDTCTVVNLVLVLVLVLSAAALVIGFLGPRFD